MSSNGEDDGRPHLVIVGGGFGGLYLAKRLKRAPMRITLIDKCNYHLFQPLLYQVATCGVSPGDIAAPLRAVLSRQKNVQVLLATATDIDIAGKRLILADGELTYDALVVATGMRTSYFGHDEWQDRAPGMKTLEDALQIRRRLLGAFEEAEREEDAARREALLTFVVVGGGPTGVELAGALAELTRHTLKNDFRHIQPAHARIHLVEGHPRLLPPFPEALSARARQDLERLGVIVHTETHVTAVESDSVTLHAATGDTPDTVLQARNVLWGAGVQTTPFATRLAAVTGATTDRAGRIEVNPDLTVGEHSDVFAIGDIASLVDGAGVRVPGVAPAAVQQGQFVADLLKRRWSGRPAPSPFVYTDKGALAVIGRNRAVAHIKSLKLKGRPAWWIWLVVHILFLVEFENKLQVVTQWAWDYLTWNKGARLITYGHPTLHGDTTPVTGATSARRAEDRASNGSTPDAL